MFNRDFVTPQAVRDSVTAAAGRLLLPIDPNRYFTSGSQRKLFLGAVQPRAGASYQLDAQGRTTVFASAGVVNTARPTPVSGVCVHVLSRYSPWRPCEEVSTTGGEGTG